MRKAPKFILASNSPRRKQLLQEAGYDFTVVAPTLEEPAAPTGLPPAQQAESLAYFKARSVVDSHRPLVPVLGADTIVALGEKVYGKAANAVEAREILSSLMGTRHSVITGVVLLAADGYRVIAADITYVRMRALNNDELNCYIDSGAWQGKAGAYGIQDQDDPFVEGYEGSFSNVVGLPMELVQAMLEQEDTRHSLGEATA